MIHHFRLLPFTHPTSPVPFGIPMRYKISNAFTAHLLTVGGLQTEVVTAGTPNTSSTRPIGQPWVGMV